MVATVDFAHTATAQERREAKAERLAQFMASTRFTRPPAPSERRDVERAAEVRPCSDETWARALELWQMRRALEAEDVTRPWTSDQRVEVAPGCWQQIVVVKRSCNGCGRQLGDVLDAELAAAVEGRPLPDVRGECGCG